MKYSKLGRTGIMVGEIGLGCEGFLGRDEKFAKDMFDIAFDAGVNCLDLYSPNPELHRIVGNVIKEKREQFILQGHLCTKWEGDQYKCTRDICEVKPAFEAMLENLDTDYIDIGMIHYVDSVNVWRDIVDGDVMKYALELKSTGKIRHIGLSSHNPVAALEAVTTGLVDVIMFSINPCYDLLPADEDIEKLFLDESYENPLFNMDAERKRLYETCQSLDVGITVMKAFGGGGLLSDKSPAGKALTVNQCIHYALTRPAVATVLVGAHSKEELMTSLAYETASDSERDYAEAFASFPKMSWRGYCMYCGHCAPCPQNIDIAMVTKLLNLAKAQDAVPETVKEHYISLAHKAASCIKCGVCERRCPFEVAVRDNMTSALEIFGS